jgi:polysaccharide biosynthesis protein PelD
MSPARWLIAESRRPAWQWLETVLLTLLAAALAYSLSPSDPFLLHAAFPWLLFAPVLLALRYGALPGLGSIALLCALWVVQREAGLVRPEPPTLHLTGALLMTLICGEFAGLWEARVGRAETSLRYVQEKLDRLTRQHYLLLTSHQRLEQDQLTRPVTLRAALARIRRLAVEAPGEGRLPGAEALTALLAQFCQLEAASLHAFSGDVPERRPVASIGAAGPLDAADPMVRHCLENRALSHVQAGELPAESGHRYVLVAPVVSSDNQLVALLAVEQMAFLALHEETLSMLGVLLGYYADVLQVSRMARVMQRALPGCPLEFADELVRMHRMREEHDVPSSLLLLRFGGHPDSAAFAAFIRRQLRDLDMVWELPAKESAEGRFEMLVLLPLAGAAAAADAMDRLENALDARYQLGFDAARIRPYAAPIEPGDPFVALRLFLDLHDVRI